MARNKYPEITVERILDVSKRLFLERGYENTTIQDIVAELGGLTKGAIYHHFKSKEDIMDALGDKLFYDNNLFSAVRSRRDLTGLEKMRQVIKLNHSDREATELGRQSVPILKNPRILAQMIETDRTLIAPYWLELLQEGVDDGSIETEYTKEISELLPLLTNLWLAPSVFPAETQELRRKFEFIGYLLEKLGLPLVDDEIRALADTWFAQIRG